MTKFTQQVEELDLPKTSACNHGTQLPSKWFMKVFTLLIGAFCCEDALVSAAWQKVFFGTQSHNRLSGFPFFVLALAGGEPVLLHHSSALYFSPAHTSFIINFAKQT